jgi:hypothetical protein
MSHHTKGRGSRRERNFSFRQFSDSSFKINDFCGLEAANLLCRFQNHVSQLLKINLFFFSLPQHILLLGMFLWRPLTNTDLCMFLKERCSWAEFSFGCSKYHSVSLRLNSLPVSSCCSIHFLHSKHALKSMIPNFSSSVPPSEKLTTSINDYSWLEKSDKIPLGPQWQSVLRN